MEEKEKQAGAVLDENTKIIANERLPILAPLKVLRYRTIKKNNALGWWSAVVLLEDHGKKKVCFYRWRRKANEWKRDKKLNFGSKAEWEELKRIVEDYIGEV